MRFGSHQRTQELMVGKEKGFSYLIAIYLRLKIYTLREQENLLYILLFFFLVNKISHSDN